jgi:short-subunit dehydrogenase involved in D-alanine esterification of teichoic acids
MMILLEKSSECVFIDKIKELSKIINILGEGSVVIDTGSGFISIPFAGPPTYCGKTADAQHVYEQATKKDDFNDAIWICIN